MLGRISSSAVIGREGELEVLAAAFSAACEGTPTITLIGGEAGVGKTRLLREVERLAQDAGGLVLWGECVPVGDGELPYAPLIAALRDLAGGSHADILEAVPESLRDELGSLVPELAVADPAPQPAASESSQARVYERLRGALDHLAEERPVLLVIEDAHWADAATRDFLAFIVRNLGRTRVALVVTYRTDELESGHPLRPLLADLIRRERVTRLRLEPLSRGQLERQLEDILGRLPDAELAEEIYRRSGGNPFLAEELLDATRDENGGAGTETLHDALLLRVDELPPPAAEVTRVVAVAGRPVDEELIGRVCGAASPGVTEALRSAMARHVLVLVPQREAYAFRHALVREALYDTLLPSERRDLHGRLARALDDLQADPGETAYHWSAAGDARAALPAALRAGLAAMRMSAFGQALTHFERALALWDEAESDEEALPLTRLDVVDRAALVARLTGHYERAVELCEEALARVDATADPLRAAALHERLGDAHYWDDEAALKAYARALELLPEDRVADRARVLGAEAHVSIFLQLFEQARRRAAVALELAEQAGAAAVEGRARMTLGVALAFLGDPDAAGAQLEAARTIAEREGAPDELARVYMAAAEAARLRGAFAMAHDLMREGADVCRRLGMEETFGRFMSVQAAEDLFRLGRWDEAERSLRATERLSLRRAAEVLQHTIVAMLAVARGSFDDAGDRIERARELCSAGEIGPEYLPGVYFACAELNLWQGRTERAREEIARGLELTGTRGDPLNTPLLYSLGLLGDAEAAEEARARGAEDAVAAYARCAVERIAGLEALIAKHSLCKPPPEAVAHLALCRAELTRVHGEPVPEAWDEAARAWLRMGNPYSAAYSRWRQAESLLAADGPRAEAAEALRDAARAARALGAGPLAAAIGGLARAARIDLAEAPSVAPAPAIAELPAGLTEREVDVVALLAEGLTNREIAERLFISESTAGVHVSNILRKLGARNRVIAAGMAHRLGLVRSPRA